MIELRYCGTGTESKRLYSYLLFTLRFKTTTSSFGATALGEPWPP
jgi:hypothetical protein